MAVFVGFYEFGAFLLGIFRTDGALETVAASWSGVVDSGVNAGVRTGKYVHVSGRRRDVGVGTRSNGSGDDERSGALVVIVGVVNGVEVVGVVVVVVVVIVRIGISFLRCCCCCCRCRRWESEFVGFVIVMNSRPQEKKRRIEDGG